MIITIGREFGSGGRELGRRLADYLKIAYYDREIIEKIAERTQLSEEYIKNVVEKHPSPLLPITVGKSFNPVASPLFQMTQSVYAEQTRIIKEMAEKSDAVIVGRCAGYILRDMHPFRIFVYADIESRMARCRSRMEDGEELSDRELMQHIKSIDRERAKYFSFYTGRKWADKTNYDMMINTTNQDIKEIVPHIANMLK